MKRPKHEIAVIRTERFVCDVQNVGLTAVPGSKSTWLITLFLNDKRIAGTVGYCPDALTAVRGALNHWKDVARHDYDPYDHHCCSFKLWSVMASLTKVWGRLGGLVWDARRA